MANSNHTVTQDTPLWEGDMGWIPLCRGKVAADRATATEEMGGGQNPKPFFFLIRCELHMVEIEMTTISSSNTYLPISVSEIKITFVSCEAVSASAKKDSGPGRVLI